MKEPLPLGVGPTERRSSVKSPDDNDSFVLSVVEGPDAGSAFVLDASTPTRALVGTGPVCTIRLTDPEISRRHAALSITQTHVQYMDLDSTNGTTVNGVVAKEVSLLGGEAVRIGASVLVVKRAERSASTLGTATGFGRILGASAAMRRIYPVIQRLAETDGPVLIEGEPGTGKQLLAEEIHRASRRAEEPFLVLEARTIPSDQIAVDLFGSSDAPGLLESAIGGVLFVDEIGDLPRHAQKRLRDLLAASTEVRLIAATRRDLDRDVADGRFDEALFFALATGHIELPRLRDREGDVPLLARNFWRELVPTDAKVEPELPVDLLPRFEHYPWPGNVRELYSVVTRRATLGELSRTYLSDRAVEDGLDLIAMVIQDGLFFPAARDRVLAGFERRYIEAMLERHGGNVTAAARASGIALRYFQIVRARAR